MVREVLYYLEEVNYSLFWVIEIKQMTSQVLLGRASCSVIAPKALLLTVGSGLVWSFIVLKMSEESCLSFGIRKNNISTQRPWLLLGCIWTISSAVHWSGITLTAADERKTPPPFAIRFVMLQDQSECFVLEWEASVVPYVEDTMSCPIFKYVVFFVNRAR
ncbi:hypothetical protein Q9966_003260 [Columba livia]|nr:hypothetical protein Q9966_003260 [Columba livia]